MIATLVNRRNIQEFRKLADRTLRRANFLEPVDRHLLKQVFEKGVRPFEIATVAGQSTRSVQRRVMRLMSRLDNPAVVYILRRHRSWPDPLAAAALALFVRGRTMRQTAAELGMSLHQTRKIVDAVRGLIDQGIHGGPTRRTVRRLVREAV